MKCPVLSVADWNLNVGFKRAPIISLQI